jgi:hypothetical protein
MESLFHPKYFSYTQKAATINKELCDVVEPIVDKYIKKGYNPREIEIIAMDAVYGTVSTALIKNGMRIKKKEKENTLWNVK